MKQNLSTVCAFFAVIASASFSEAAISLLDGVAYTQNFNSLASSGATNITMPTDWVFAESGSNANTSYGAGTGSGTAGDTYSFGTNSSDRALGGLRSGSLVPTFGASFKNDVGASTIDLTIVYTGEQWRLGSTGRADRIDFQYSLNATSLITGTWTDFNTLDFSSPITTGTTGALDGNLNANKTSISSSITGLSVANGATFWIRWTDFDASGSDDGLAVDDFSITAVPETSTSLLGAIGVIALLRRRR